MARPKKEGLDYFPLDTDMFSDEKVRILKARYGTDGIALYLYILCRIYRHGYYVRYDEDFDYVAAEELQMSVAKVQQIMTYLFSRSLLTKLTKVSTLVIPVTIITSHGIQRRFQQAVKARAQKTPIAVEEAFWLLKKTETESFIKVSNQGGFSENNPSFSRKNHGNSKINAIKESKVNNYIYYSNPELDEVFGLYIRMRNSNQMVPLTEDQIRLLQEELDRSGNTDEERIAVCKKAYVSGWKSFYPIHKQKEKKDKTKKNAFHNFDQREGIDYDDLEKKLIEKTKNKSDIY